MFCQYCGKQLPDNARFCDACGGPVNSQQLPPTVFKDISQQAPPQPSPSYTVPLDPEKAQQYTVPLDEQTQQGQYTPPVNSGYQDAAPVNSQVPTPVTSGFQGTVPQPSAPTQPQPGKKRVRKLPILLGAIAVVLVIVLVAVFAGGDPIEESTVGKASSDSSSAGSAQKDSFPEGELRFDSQGFLFAEDEFMPLYEQTLKLMEVPYTDSGSHGKAGESEFYYWLADAAGNDVVQIHMVDDKTTGKLRKVYASSITQNNELPTEDQIMACVCAIQACHGAVTEAQWDAIFEKMPTSDTDMTTTYDVNLDGMDVRIAVGNGNNSVIVGCSILESEGGSASAATETQAPTSESVVDPDAALRDFPMGQMHFSGTSFLFDAREGMGLFQASLEGTDLPLVVADVTEMGEGKYNYSLFTTSGADVGWMIVQEDTATGKVLEMSLNYTYQENEDEDLYGMQAALCMIEIAHGALTDAQWDSIGETKPMAVEEDYTMYRFRYDGMKAMLTVREAGLHLGISIDG